MVSDSSQHITVLVPEESESWGSFARRVQGSKGDLIVIISGRDRELSKTKEDFLSFLDECKKVIRRLRIASRNQMVIKAARERGMRTVERTKELSAILGGHEKKTEALRSFSPHIWHQQLTSHLQAMGLLSLPRMRVFSLVGLSVVLFSFVIFRLLPSAEIRVFPRRDSINQTANINLVASGATVALPAGIPRMRLFPLTVRVNRTLTFDQISKEFTGQAAKMQLTVVNKTEQPFSLRTGTRFSNQAGMIFRIQSGIVVPAKGELTTPAVADPTDLYGQIIGERGNVPAGLKWDIPALSEEERKLIYGENRTKGQGGTTAYKTVLNAQDLEIAKERLAQELEAAAKQMIEDRRAEWNQQHPEGSLQIINLPSLIRKNFPTLTLPTQFLGQPVQSIPVEGVLDYTILAYDNNEILAYLSQKLVSHVREGKQLIEETLAADHMDVRVIYFADDFSWVKMTADLTASEEFILDPLSPTGALFGKKVREQVLGLHHEDALHIVQNMPEVERAEISLWPPWHRSLPSIPSHIAIAPQ